MLTPCLRVEGSSGDHFDGEWTIIDLGPGAGHDGGLVVFEGTPTDLVEGRSTPTGEHLADYLTPTSEVERREP